MIELSQRVNTPRKDKLDIAPSRTPQITKTSKTPLRKFIITDSDSDNDEALCTSITRMKIAPLEEEIEGGNRLVSGDIIRQTPLNAIIVDTSDNENEDYFYNSSLDAVTKNTPNAIVKKETAHVIVDSEDEEIDLAEDYEIELESPLVMVSLVCLMELFLIESWIRKLHQGALLLTATQTIPFLNALMVIKMTLSKAHWLR